MKRKSKMRQRQCGRDRERESSFDAGSVWIWRPDDLRLQSRLALTVVSGERGANLKLSGDPQPCDRKARAGTPCQKPTEQSSDPYLEDSSVKIHRADKGVYIQLRFLSRHSFTVRHAVRAKSGFLSQTNSVSPQERGFLFRWRDRQCISQSCMPLAQKGTAWAYLSVYPPNKHTGSPGDLLCVVMAVLQTQQGCIQGLCTSCVYQASWAIPQ